MKTQELRENFINYMRSKKHKLLPPSKVYLDDDLSILFVNAGMNQLKDTFISGNIKQDEKFRRLCNSQICIRAGGKHNDLDDVGKDSYHLTSFEMLGSWSLDSYSREETLDISFNYLINYLNLDPKKMYVTYYDGNDIISEDTETKNLWKKYLPESNIIKGNFKDNFWMMGESGPCGVSTEIHYDISNIDRFVPELVNQDDPSVIEIWNMVFIEYKCKDGKFSKLEKKFVDTGIGLERLSMIIQNTKTVYDTDAFYYLFGYCQALTNQKYSYQDTYNVNKIDETYRIFADHMRTLTISLFQDVEFNTTGRGNILRKIFRRMLSYLYCYHNNFNIEPIMNKPIIKAIITDILNYFLLYKHDSSEIQTKLILEEKLFLNILFNLRKKIECLKDYDINNYELIECFITKNKIKSILDKLKADGIPFEIIKNRTYLKKIKKYN
ncbi:MAG: hypothetical protein CMF62_02975 [Magnetococcales bacterium]|nr:hypothetical protein [Magnetococcales bacterium]|tara:strand:+ start:6584 stop:7900 length:1317 start_codon:yes stop_codon:yes gene_type:complete